MSIVEGYTILIKIMAYEVRMPAHCLEYKKRQLKNLHDSLSSSIHLQSQVITKGMVGHQIEKGGRLRSFKLLG